MSDCIVLAYDYPPNDGGISRLAAGIVEGLIRLAHVPEVITLRSSQSKGLVRPVCRHYEISRRRGIRELQTLAHMSRISLAWPVIATIWNPEATLAMLAGHTRVTILAHGNELMDYPGWSLKAGLRRHVLGRARWVVCNSAHTEGLVRGIAPTARTAVLNPAVDAKRFVYSRGREEARQRLGLPSAKRIVLSVSRLDAMKGHETVLQALAAMAPARRDQILHVIAGRGPHAAALKERSKRLGLAAQVRFLGFVPDDDLPALYTAADLFALCSIEDRTRRAIEGFGMVFTEAQAAGLAVIGTRSGGIPDAVREGEGGWLIAERDAEALRPHLETLVDEPSVFHAEGLRGRARVRREHCWDDYVRNLVALI